MWIVFILLFTCTLSMGLGTPTPSPTPAPTPAPPPITRIFIAGCSNNILDYASAPAVGSPAAAPPLQLPSQLSYESIYVDANATFQSCSGLQLSASALVSIAPSAGFVSSAVTLVGTSSSAVVSVAGSWTQRSNVSIGGTISVLGVNDSATATLRLDAGSVVRVLPSTVVSACGAATTLQLRPGVGPWLDLSAGGITMSSCDLTIVGTQQSSLGQLPLPAVWFSGVASQQPYFYQRFNLTLSSVGYTSIGGRWGADTALRLVGVSISLATSALFAVSAPSGRFAVTLDESFECRGCQLSFPQVSAGMLVAGLFNGSAVTIAGAVQPTVAGRWIGGSALTLNGSTSPLVLSSTLVLANASTLSVTTTKALCDVTLVGCAIDADVIRGAFLSGATASFVGLTFTMLAGVVIGEGATVSVTERSDLRGSVVQAGSMRLVRVVVRLGGSLILTSTSGATRLTYCGVQFESGSSSATANVTSSLNVAFRGLGTADVWSFVSTVVSTNASSIRLSVKELDDAPGTCDAIGSGGSAALSAAASLPFPQVVLVLNRCSNVVITANRSQAVVVIVAGSITLGGSSWYNGSSVTLVSVERAVQTAATVSFSGSSVTVASSTNTSCAVAVVVQGTFFNSTVLVVNSGIQLVTVANCMMVSTSLNVTLDDYSAPLLFVGNLLSKYYSVAPNSLNCSVRSTNVSLGLVSLDTVMLSDAAVYVTSRLNYTHSNVTMRGSANVSVSHLGSSFFDTINGSTFLGTSMLAISSAGVGSLLIYGSLLADSAALSAQVITTAYWDSSFTMAGQSTLSLRGAYSTQYGLSISSSCFQVALNSNVSLAIAASNIRTVETYLTNYCGTIFGGLSLTSLALGVCPQNDISALASWSGWRLTLSYNGCSTRYTITGRSDFVLSLIGFDELYLSGSFTNCFVTMHVGTFVHLAYPASLTMTGGSLAVTAPTVYLNYNRTYFTSLGLYFGAGTNFYNYRSFSNTYYTYLSVSCSFTYDGSTASRISITNGGAPFQWSGAANAISLGAYDASVLSALFGTMTLTSTSLRVTSTVGTPISWSAWGTAGIVTINSPTVISIMGGSFTSLAVTSTADVYYTPSTIPGGASVQIATSGSFVASSLSTVLSGAVFRLDAGNIRNLGTLLGCLQLQSLSTVSVRSRMNATSLTLFSCGTFGDGSNITLALPEASLNVSQLGNASLTVTAARSVTLGPGNFSRASLRVTASAQIALPTNLTLSSGSSVFVSSPSVVLSDSANGTFMPTLLGGSLLMMASGLPANISFPVQITGPTFTGGSSLLISVLISAQVLLIGPFSGGSVTLSTVMGTLSLQGNFSDGFTMRAGWAVCGRVCYSRHCRGNIVASRQL